MEVIFESKDLKQMWKDIMESHKLMHLLVVPSIMEELQNSELLFTKVTKEFQKDYKEPLHTLQFHIYFKEEIINLKMFELSAEKYYYNQNRTGNIGYLGINGTRTSEFEIAGTSSIVDNIQNMYNGSYNETRQLGNNVTKMMVEAYNELEEVMYKNQLIPYRFSPIEELDYIPDDGLPF